MATLWLVLGFLWTNGPTIAAVSAAMYGGWQKWQSTKALSKSEQSEARAKILRSTLDATIAGIALLPDCPATRLAKETIKNTSTLVGTEDQLRERLAIVTSAMAAFGLGTSADETAQFSRAAQAVAVVRERDAAK